MFDLIYRFDPNSRHADTAPADADEASRRLEDGNKQFAQMLTAAFDPATVSQVLRFDADDLGLPREDGGPPTQKPFAAILGCSDARVPTEMIFGQACNDLFVVRVAGNVLGSECLGSLDYALTNLEDSLKLVVVLGHSGCGAVTAAVDAFIDPTRYLEFASSHPLRAVVDRIFVATRAAHSAILGLYGPSAEQSAGFRRALIETTVVLNAAVTAATVQAEFSKRLSPDQRVVFGVYNLVTRRVKVSLESDDNVAIRMVPPPDDAAGFGRLGLLLASSSMVRELLGAERGQL